MSTVPTRVFEAFKIVVHKESGKKTEDPFSYKTVYVNTIGSVKFDKTGHLKVFNSKYDDKQMAQLIKVMEKSPNIRELKVEVESKNKEDKAKEKAEAEAKEKADKAK